MTIHHQDSRVTLHHGDCLDVLRTLPDASVDSVVCDPPYGLEFMGKEWDSFKAGGKRPTIGEADGSPMRRNTGTPSFGASGNPGCRKCGGQRYGNNPARQCGCEVPDFPNHMAGQMHAFQQWCELWAAECLRVLKPGGHLLAFGGTRTWHRLACAVEDAGFEVRDSIAWLYGSGFPKSLDVSKAIDKAAGAEREVTGTRPGAWNGSVVGLGTEGTMGTQVDVTAPATDAAREWAGWGTALKPAFEPVVVARKPLVGTVAANVTAHGTGALNIDGTRIGWQDESERDLIQKRSGRRTVSEGWGMTPEPDDRVKTNPSGRWPANVILDEDVAGVLDEQSGTLTNGTLRAGTTFKGKRNTYGNDAAGGYATTKNFGGDSGGASRYFTTINREDDPWHTSSSGPTTTASDPCTTTPAPGGNGPQRPQTTTGDAANPAAEAAGSAATSSPASVPRPIDDLSAPFLYQAKAPKRERPVVDGVAHPTVKPLALMRWLVRLVTPPGGTVLEPFAGSGTTVEACLVESFQCIAIEKGDEYLPLVLERIRRQTEPPEVEHLTRRTDPEAAIVEQVREMSLFELDGEGA